MPCMFTQRANPAPYSKVHGYKCSATAKACNAFGVGTKATAPGQVAMGMYNAEDNDAMLIIGNGTSDTDRRNVLAVRKDGRVLFNGREQHVIIDVSEQSEALGSFDAWLTPDNIDEILDDFIKPVAYFIYDTISVDNPTPVILRYSYTDKDLTKQSAAYHCNVTCAKLTNAAGNEQCAINLYLNRTLNITNNTERITLNRVVTSSLVSYTWTVGTTTRSWSVSV